MSSRAAHEAHVTGLQGSWWLEVVVVVYTVLPLVMLLQCLCNTERSVLRRAMMEAAVLVLPCCALLTVLSSSLIATSIVITISATSACWWRWTTCTLHSKANKSKSESPNTQTEKGLVNKGRRHSVSLVRGILGLLTAISILAVDFHVFPRRFAKTEEFGYSLMDIGPSAFLLINALSDARRTAFCWKLTAKSCCALVLLGTVRLLSLPATDYQQHVTEYGVHCNFFFVLALIKILMSWCSRLNSCVLFVVASMLTVAQHYNTAVLQIWVLSKSNRDSLVTANRETVVALPGHAALYCWGALYGQFLFKTKQRSYALRASLQEVIYVSGVMMVLALLNLCILGGVPSRRLVNAEFILWMVFMFAFLMMLSNAMEIFLSTVLKSSNVVPVILQAISDHLLLFFLVANVLTGSINMTINTLQVDAPWSIALLSVYSLLLCLIVVILLINSEKEKEN